MSVKAKTVNNDIIITAVREVGKFAGVKFSKKSARLFLDMFCAVLGKYFYDNPDCMFHLNKYVVSKTINSKYNMFNVNVFRQDEYIHNADDLYDYYVLEGREKRELMKKIEEFAEKLLEASISEEMDSTDIINKLSTIKKGTQRRLSRKANERKAKKVENGNSKTGD